MLLRLPLLQVDYLFQFFFHHKLDIFLHLVNIMCPYLFQKDILKILREFQFFQDALEYFQDFHIILQVLNIA